MKLSTKEQQESYENAKICYICKEITRGQIEVLLMAYVI